MFARLTAPSGHYVSGSLRNSTLIGAHNIEPAESGYLSHVYGGNVTVVIRHQHLTSNTRVKVHLECIGDVSVVKHAIRGSIVPS